MVAQTSSLVTLQRSNSLVTLCRWHHAGKGRNGRGTAILCLLTWTVSDLIELPGITVLIDKAMYTVHDYFIPVFIPADAVNFSVAHPHAVLQGQNAIDSTW